MGEFRSFTRSVRHQAVPMQPVVDPAGWQPHELGDVSEWAYAIDESDADALSDAVAAFRRTGAAVVDVNRDNFPLGRFAELLADVKRELLDGRGMVMLRGFPIERWDRETIAVAYLGLGSHLGDKMAQNGHGHVLGHVKDIGGDYETGRGYNSNAGLRFHADGCDYVGLLCLKISKSGGESRVASSVTVYNKLLESRPDLVEILRQDLYRSHNGEMSPGETPWFTQPIFSFAEGYFSATGAGSTIEKAQRIAGVPPLTPIQREAVAVYREMAAQCALDIPFAPGDIQFLNNYVMLHSRRGYEDWPEFELRRHLLRLWLRDAEGRPIPESQRAGRSGRGIQIAGLQLVAPLDVGIAA